MKDIDSMPLKCHDCPYWEQCEEPYVCPDTEQMDVGIILEDDGF